ncbi:MAG TPA: hypothetical protein VG754_05520 [Verrucomicrobiae bacterium]|nr:hypothetical protein [Verrucomicrobiae bacterium]
MKPDLLILFLTVAVGLFAAAFRYFARWRKARSVSPVKLRQKNSAVVRRNRDWRWF